MLAAPVRHKLVCGPPPAPGSPMLVRQHAFKISTYILLYAVMSFLYYNTCQHTGECMSTCIRNFNMHVNKIFMSAYKRACIRNFHMHINKNFMSTYKKIHVNIQKNACRRKIACQHTAPFPDEKVLDLDAPALQPLCLSCCSRRSCSASSSSGRSCHHVGCTQTGI